MAELLGCECEREGGRDSRLDLRHGADSGGLHRVRRASGACIRRRPATDWAALLHEFGIAEAGEADLESRPRPTWRCAGRMQAALQQVRQRDGRALAPPLRALELSSFRVYSLNAIRSTIIQFPAPER